MNKEGKLRFLAVKCGCHCTYTNENSGNGNQKATSESWWCFFQTKITYNHFIVQFSFLTSHCDRSVEPTYKINKQFFRLQWVLQGYFYLYFYSGAEQTLNRHQQWKLSSHVHCALRCSQIPAFSLGLARSFYVKGTLLGKAIVFFFI